MEFKSFYKKVGGDEGTRCHYPTRLDTYGCGCSHDCKYCYAKSLLEFRGLWKPTEPSVADIEKIRRKIKTLRRGSVVRLGGMTDCFQPAEAIHGVTYETIKALNEAGIHYLIVTKSDLVASNKYMAIMDKKLAHIQVSITSTSDEIAKTYEKACPTSRRIKAIERLYEAGFDVSLRVSPLIPQNIDFGALNAIKCDKVLIEFLRVNSWIQKWLPMDYSEYTVKSGGYRHLPLDKKIAIVDKITGFKEVSVCEDEPEAYVYWNEYVNHNPNDCCNLKFF